MSEKTRKILRIITWILFIVYLILLCYFLFFAEIMGRTYTGRNYHYYLVPLKEIGRFIKYRESLGVVAVMANLIGNVVAFIPYGMLVPTLSHKCRQFGYVVLLSFDFSLVIELIQLVSKVGSFDVDDLILNTIGGALGFVCFLFAKLLLKALFREK